MPLQWDHPLIPQMVGENWQLGFRSQDLQVLQRAFATPRFLRDYGTLSLGYTSGAEGFFKVSSDVFHSYDIARFCLPMVAKTASLKDPSTRTLETVPDSWLFHPQPEQESDLERVLSDPQWPQRRSARDYIRDHDEVTAHQQKIAGTDGTSKAVRHRPSVLSRATSPDLWYQQGNPRTMCPDVVLPRYLRDPWVVRENPEHYVVGQTYVGLTFGDDVSQRERSLMVAFLNSSVALALGLMIAVPHSDSDLLPTTLWHEVFPAPHVARWSPEHQRRVLDALASLKVRSRVDAWEIERHAVDRWQLDLAVGDAMGLKETDIRQIRELIEADLVMKEAMQVAQKSRKSGSGPKQDSMADRVRWVQQTQGWQVPLWPCAMDSPRWEMAPRWRHSLLVPRLFYPDQWSLVITELDGKVHDYDVSDAMAMYLQWWWTGDPQTHQGAFPVPQPEGCGLSWNGWDPAFEHMLIHSIHRYQHRLQESVTQCRQWPLLQDVRDTELWDHLILESFREWRLQRRD